MDKKTAKIGILTFHKAINYGSVLQAWALQNTLKMNGYDSEIIDYEPKELRHLYETSLKEFFLLKEKYLCKEISFCVLEKKIYI